MITPVASHSFPTDTDVYQMTLNEARKVLWHKANPRPMGELFDEGYLSRSRLEWAVANAYNSRMKRAAMILLKQLRPVTEQTPISSPYDSVKLNITVAQARATLWPLPPYKGQPMGTLVDSKQLSLKDLGYAAENAWDKQVRLASSALLLVRLNQKIEEPAPSAGLVNVISSGRSFSESKQLHINFVQGFIGGSLLASLLAVLIWSTYKTIVLRSNVPAAISTYSPFTIGLALLLAGLLGWGLAYLLVEKGIFNKLDNQIENHHKGQVGEEKTIEVILQTLDGNWTLFRNLQLPGRNKADLDAVLVGPPGVWVLEIKNLSGMYRNIGDRWEYKAKNKWNAFQKNPSRQVHQAAARLGNFLKADGIKQWVQPAVVWVDTECPPSIENPMVPVWPLDRLPDELGNLWLEEKLSADLRTRIVNKLVKLCKSSG